jgi:hypothetical protein
MAEACEAGWDCDHKRCERITCGGGIFQTCAANKDAIASRIDGDLGKEIL